ncbi:MAG: class I adenylate-forming enzyme family protein [Gammaproteobacteria bacterium]|nr:class I adenylate-forming enzyme family protein [Gammaproteobacteria bacterium]
MNINPAEFQDKLITDYLYLHAETMPGKEAVGIGESMQSYADLRESVEKCARALLALGIRKGDRVATLSPPHPDYFIILLATTMIGGVWLGLNPRYSRAELEHVIADAEPSVIFARTRIDKRRYRDELHSICGSVRSVKQLIVLGSDFTHPPDISYSAFLLHGNNVGATDLAAAQSSVRSMDAAFLVYTSGTTGKPKGAVLHHYGAIRHSHVQVSLRSPGAVRMINPYPINHIAGIIACSVYCLVTGGTGYYLEKFDPEAVLRTIEEKRISVWGGVPVMLQKVLDHPDFSTTDLSSIKEISCSGGTASKPLLERLIQEICPAVTTMYALTEAAGAVTAIPSTNDVDLLAESVGKPLDDCEFRLVDERGEEVRKGEPGEILIRGPFIMKEYWRLPEATGQAIDDEGWLHTKDVAVKRDDGNIILVGRLSDMYKSGGYNVYPKEIEQALEAHPAVNLACVVGVPDPVYGEVGHAFVTLAPGQTAAEQILLDHCRRYLANYKIPKQVVIETSLPLLPNNKPDKRRLKQTAGDAVKPDADQAAPCNANQR